MSNHRKENLLKILNFFLLMQRHNRSVSEVRLAEEMILVILDIQKRMNVTELINYLKCPQSYLSNILKKLTNNGLLEYSKSPLDKRIIFYSLTAKGKKRVEEIDLESEARLSEIQNRLKVSEINSFVRYIHKMADCYGIAREGRIRKENIMRSAQRRGSSVIGITGSKVLGTDISSTRLHILKMISDNDTFITAQDLTSELFLSSASVSLFLKDVQKNNLLTYKKSLKDQRIKYISLTKSGKDYYKNIWKDLIFVFQGIFSSFSNQEIIELVNILEKLLLPEIRAKSVKKSDYKTLRPVLIQMLVDNHNLNEMPAIIAAPDSKIYEIKAETGDVLYFQINDDKLDLCCWDGKIKKFEAVNILQRVLQNKSKVAVVFKPFL